jgi:hypothetical protein
VALPKLNDIGTLLSSAPYGTNDEGFSGPDETIVVDFTIVILITMPDCLFTDGRVSCELEGQSRGGDGFL